MKMQEVFLTEQLGYAAPIYDKDPGPAYVIDGPQFACPGRESSPKEEGVVEVTVPHRVHVPMALVVELKKSIEDLVFDLVRHVAELGNWVEYEDNFTNIRAYFDSVDLPLYAVVKHPSLGLEVPAGVLIIDHAAMLRERAYCLTAPELLGRLPVRHKNSEVGFDGNDEHGLIRNAISLEQRGFLIFNPKGLLTVFVDPPYP